MHVITNQQHCVLCILNLYLLTYAVLLISAHAHTLYIQFTHVYIHEFILMLCVCLYYICMSVHLYVYYHRLALLDKENFVYNLYVFKCELHN